LLLLAALALIIASFFISNQAIDLHIHDTYFVIAVEHIFWAVSLLLLFHWILYRLLNNLLFSIFLSWMNILLTVICCAMIVWLILDQRAAGVRTYFDFSIWERSHDHDQNLFAGIILTSFSGLVVFLINLVVGILKKKNRTDNSI